MYQHEDETGNEWNRGVWESVNCTRECHLEEREHSGEREGLQLPCAHAQRPFVHHLSEVSM